MEPDTGTQVLSNSRPPSPPDGIVLMVPDADALAYSGRLVARFLGKEPEAEEEGASPDDERKDLRRKALDSADDRAARVSRTGRGRGR